jgi:hypothetical protein
MVLKLIRDCFRDRACRLGSISIDLLLQIEPSRQKVNIVTSNCKNLSCSMKQIDQYRGGLAHSGAGLCLQAA